MRFLLVVATVLILFPRSSWAAWGKAYVDLEDGEYLSVFNDPGVDYATCAQNKSCETLGWLDNKSDVEIVSDPVKVPKLDYRTGKVVDTEFVQVRFSYDRKNPDGRRALKKDLYGWVELASLKQEKFATFYGSDPLPAPTPCPPKPKLEVAKPKEAIQVAIPDVKRALENKAVVATAEAVAPFVGKCVIDPKNLPSNFKGPITYDNYALPTMNKQSVPNLQKEGGAPVTKEDMVAIDALARTIYSEMASCFKRGLHYPSAVARISYNRTQALSRSKEFINGPHAAGKSQMAKVVTSPYMFSAWNPKIDGNRNASVVQALCPPAGHNSIMWTGRAPPQFEKDIWDNTLRIATEAVLFPTKLKSRSPNLTQLFYTSALDRPKWRQVHPKVEGRSIDRDSCMMVWQD